MTTYVAFKPSNTTPFSFEATLDGSQYTISTAWSLFGQRYYVKCQTLQGSLIFNVPLIGSIGAYHIQAVSWNNGVVSMDVDAPFYISPGASIQLTVSGTTPEAYNGTRVCYVTAPNSFSFDLPLYPGEVAKLGSVTHDVNLAGGYFSNSSLVYRGQNATFEITP